MDGHKAMMSVILGGITFVVIFLLGVIIAMFGPMIITAVNASIGDTSAGFTLTVLLVNNSIPIFLGLGFLAALIIILLGVLNAVQIRK